jgi:hypothetical protein
MHEYEGTQASIDADDRSGDIFRVCGRDGGEDDDGSVDRWRR